MYGFWGKVVRVDLTRGVSAVYKVNEAFYRKYLGGVGIATKIIFDEVRPDVGPLSPDNVIVLGVGPFQGTTIPGSGRWIVASRSPLTGIWADSCGGGNWGPEFKFTGFDALAVRGRAKSPIYLWIHDGEVETRDASGIWGMKTSESDREIKKDIGEPKARIVCIGPAGEKLVRFACVMNEHGVAGRCGLGAVMGSKNLKAIAVKGSKEVEVAKPDELKQCNKRIIERLQTAFKGVTNSFKNSGTVFGIKRLYMASRIGMKNWSEGTFDEMPNLYGEKIAELFTAPIACTNCLIACHKRSKVEEPKEYAYEGYGPEYETVGMLGPLCLISDRKAVAYMGNLCDEYGVDTITMGSSIALCMESYEKGWLKKEELDGIELNWGDADAAIALIHKSVKREGFGDVLAEGIEKTAEVIGGEAPDVVMHVKGLDFPAKDPRGFFPQSINYATGTRGACHQRGFPGWMTAKVVIPEWGVEQQDRHVMENAGFTAAKYQDWAVLFNSLVQCEYYTFVGLTLRDQIELLSNVTGWNVDATDMAEIAERVFTLQRVINVRYGISKKDDTLPKRVFEPLKTGGSAGKIPVPFERELRTYYKLRGWDSDGKPTTKKLTELGLVETLRPIWEA